MIKTVCNRSELDIEMQVWRDQKLTVGFVPTMGALHEGHLSLVKRALEEADRCIVSIFVNPTQFAPHEDFASYPRQEETDIELLTQAGAHLVYIPNANDMYPDGLHQTIKAGRAARGLESDFRPHFFDGVVTIVHKLFDHVNPDLAVFGEKDYQQLCVVRELAQQHHKDIKIIGAPVIRDSEGLALSSRNAYFSPAQFRQAQQLNKALSGAAAQIRENPEKIIQAIAGAIDKIRQAGFEEVQYLELRDAHTLQPVSTLDRPARLLTAAKIAGVRLIDNVSV
jgi:pantoate--beta-alanine ligase